MTFWWQRARPPTDSRGSSNLVAKVRLVPVWRQNAVMVLSPPEYKNSIIELIEQLDQPGRQVLISAIVAEVSRDDATSLGLRWSSSAISPATNPDNSISIGAGARGTESQIFGNNLFDTSVLNVNANLNVLLQALAQKTAVNILSEPKIFTSDNQEAEFFDGQDIPFVTDSQTNEQGNLVQSFDYRAVGIQLRARPRITPDRKVDLRVNLELSSIVPGQTLFGGFIVDRRETTTQVIVKNGQTIVISGILRSEDSDVLRKVPLLGDIPLLGRLFRSRDKTVKETELVVFITPVVVDNVDDVDGVPQPLRGPLDTLRERFHWDEKNRGEAADLRENK
jgi:general secretion pathway protein D